MIGQVSCRETHSLQDVVGAVPGGPEGDPHRSGRELAGGGQEFAQALNIVGHVQNDPATFDVPTVEPPRRQRAVGPKGPQRLTHVLGGDARPQSRRRRGQDVEDVEPGMTAHCDRHAGDRPKIEFQIPQNHQPAVAHRRVPMPLGLTQSEEPGWRRGLFGHATYKRLVSIEHHPTRRVCDANHRRLDHGQLFNGIDAVAAEMVSGDIGHHRHIDPSHAHPPEQQPSPGGFQYRKADAGLGQHPPGTARSAEVTGLEEFTVTEHAVGAGPRRGSSRDPRAVRDEPGRRGLAIGATDRHARHTRVEQVERLRIGWRLLPQEGRASQQGLDDSGMRARNRSIEHWPGHHETVVGGPHDEIVRRQRNPEARSGVQDCGAHLVAAVPRSDHGESDSGPAHVRVRSGKDTDVLNLRHKP